VPEKVKGSAIFGTDIEKNRTSDKIDLDEGRRYAE